jgi:hypothetical protein
VPPGFPYFYVQFGYAAGYLHVIDDEGTFDRDFGAAPGRDFRVWGREGFLGFGPRPATCIVDDPGTFTGTLVPRRLAPLLPRRNALPGPAPPPPPPAPAPPGRQVAVGLLRLPAEEMHRRQRPEPQAAQERAAAQFRQAFDKYDWTRALA